MTEAQIELLIAQRAVPEKTQELICVETHISWVLLTDHFAYKIKKPLVFSFLDFSTLQRRKYYCEKEILLNARLTSGVYLEVLPIREKRHLVWIGGNDDGKIIDYAVKMKRLDNHRQMHQLLEKNEVTPAQAEQLALQLAAFHTKAEVIREPFDLNDLNEKFADILKIRSFIVANWGEDAAQQLEQIVILSFQFLQQHAMHFQARSQAGYIIDGHGDLHSGNIFLLESPVIFDCIEFNDRYRYVDMLDEIAFLCLDFDFYNRPDLEAHFLQIYLPHMPCLKDETDQKIFYYYKLYRANVRLKVTVLRIMQEHTIESFKIEQNKALKYFQLLQRYAQLLS